MNTSKIVSGLIEAAKELGLEDFDINNSKELLENREYGLAFHTIITQLYEYEIEIDGEFYALIVKVAQKMEISEEEYSFMMELIRAENVVPKPVKDRLALILATLEINK
ncbi:MAG: MafI family immunity protein [Balneolaceae bacterium]